MAVTREFILTNTVATGLKKIGPGNVVFPGTSIVGFCTGASLLFAKECLRTPTWFPRARTDAPWSDGLAQVMMHKVNTQNGDANALAETAGMKQTTGFKNATTADLVALELAQTESKVGIFWNSYHTIGIKQAKRGTVNELRVWDQNFGFYTMGTGELGAYYSSKYPHSGWRGTDQLMGYLGLAL